jgi:hypothetical protein
MAWALVGGPHSAPSCERKLPNPARAAPPRLASLPQAAFELFRRGGINYKISNVYLWNVVSWDVQVRGAGERGRAPGSEAALGAAARAGESRGSAG